MIKQDLSPEHGFQGHQLRLDMLAMNYDTATTIFSDECRFILGSDKQWHDIRRGEWNETCFAVDKKFPSLL
jgi:hypothetical protein